MKDSLLFLTGNRGKLAEASAILSDLYKVANKVVDLVEIQSTSVEEVMVAKLAQAADKVDERPFFCEDTGLYIEALNGFPGALVKFYLAHLGIAGIATQVGGSPAYAETVLGYYDGVETHFFTGRIKGHIAHKPKGTGFGWDPIFIPEGESLTFGQMLPARKNKLSMRGIALRQLKEFLHNQ